MLRFILSAMFPQSITYGTNNYTIVAMTTQAYLHLLTVGYTYTCLHSITYMHMIRNVLNFTTIKNFHINARPDGIDFQVLNQMEEFRP